MRIRRIAAAASTVLVAIVVALAVPVSQLRTFSVVTACCCPDPAHCHCPDHQPDHSKRSSMHACHKSSHEIVSPQAPAFTPPEVALAAAPARVTRSVPAPIAASYATCDLARPDAPS